MKFTRRHARALTAGAVTSAAYLAGAKASDARVVRGSALLLLGVVATLGAQALPIAKTTKKRLDTHIAATAPAVSWVATNGANIASMTNYAYLRGLSALPSQSDTNSTLAGVLTWANNKQDNMDAHGF